jgi:hypothetical protein
MIKSTRLSWATCMAVVGLVVMATPARAQSAIAGTVKDTSGAVMPGVTVEASSPVLIEKARSAVSDENGQYRIIDLRPGTYELTFTLVGFNTIKRDFELPANFTATINVELSVGTLQESVTVSGASPVVDVASNQTQQTLTREMLDAVPTSRTIQGLGQLVVGVTLSQPDVGGSRAMQQTYFAIRGTSREQTIVTVDGQITNGLMFDGGVQAYHNEAMVQETVFRTAGGNAEAISGGLNLNLIPKDGGNTFSGTGYGYYSPSSWQGNNLTDNLVAKGVNSVDKIDRFYEFALSQGGPIVPSKVWFFASYKRARYDKPVANTLKDDGSQGVSDEVIDNPVIRGTWQVSEKNKIAAYTDRAFRFRGHAMEPGDDPETASVVWHTPTFMTGSIKWTSTLTNRLLLEAGFSMANQRYDNKYQDGIEQPRGTLGWYQNVRHVDNGRSTSWGAGAAQLGNYPNRRNFAVSTSYVTGAHNMKFGVQDSWGNYALWRNANADLYQLYTNGQANQVTVLNTPLNWEQKLDYNLGLFAQDSWRFNRLTLNYGLRLDSARESVVGQDAQQGRFANSLAYGDIQLPRWTNLSPRASVIYDIFGDGRTAVRFGFNKFMTNITTGLAEVYNPTALQTSNLPWTDVNGDDIAQGERGCTYLTPGCEINFGSLPSSFGIRALSTFDPDLKRPYMYAYNVGVQHEVLPGVSVTAEWFRNDFKDLMARNNILRTADSYTPVDVVSPLDGRVLTAYNVKTEFQNQVQNVDTTDPDLAQTYNGLEINFNARLGRGARGTHGDQLVQRGGYEPEPAAVLRRLDERCAVEQTVQGLVQLPAAVVRSRVQRCVPSAAWLHARHHAVARRVPGARRRPQSAERSRHAMADHTDDQVCGELPGAVPSGRAGHSWTERHADDSTGRARHRTDTAADPARPLGNQAVHAGWPQRGAEARLLQRAELRRLLRRPHVGVRRHVVSATEHDHAGTDHSTRC